MTEDERTERLHEIVRAHFDGVWKFLRRLGFDRDTADDATQELFLVVRRRLDEIHPERERAFLFGAAFRIATHLKRKRSREVPTVQLGDDSESDEGDTTPEERLDDERARALLYRLMSELDEAHRVVFVMFELERMTMQEIADTLDVPLGTVASRLRRARDDFRGRLERHRMRTRRGEST